MPIKAMPNAEIIPTQIYKCQIEEIVEAKPNPTASTKPPSIRVLRPPMRSVKAPASGKHAPSKIIASEIAPAVMARDQPNAVTIATKKTPKYRKSAADCDMQKRQRDQAV